ncbi:MAG: hypothetical protein ACREJ3_04135 [Polyangiaceae bacterium]
MKAATSVSHPNARNRVLLQASVLGFALSGRPWLGVGGLSADGKVSFTQGYYRNDGGVGFTWEIDPWMSGQTPKELGWRIFCGHNETLPFLKTIPEGG